MPQMRVQRRGVDINKAAEQWGIDVQELKEGLLTEMATMLVNLSPVDSGTYVKNHEIGLRSGRFSATGRRSPNAPRRSKGANVSVEAEKQTARQLLADDIAQVDLKAESFVIRNGMEYAGLIEAGITGQRDQVNPPPYASTVREAPRMIQEVAQRIAARNR